MNDKSLKFSHFSRILMGPQKFLNQVRAWFLEIAFVREVSVCMCVHVCVCVCARARVCVCVRPLGYKKQFM